MSRKKQQTTKFITKDILKSSVIGAFKKLDPRYMLKNPVMFVVEVGFVITFVLCFMPNLFGDVTASGGISEGALRTYNIIVTLILFITVLFANFAESVAEGRGKAQAETLKKTKKDTVAHLVLPDGSERDIPACDLKKGDVVIVRINELIPNDGEVVEGIASVDESAITGESAPVTRESGGDFSSVTGGTTVVSDWLKVQIAAEPGESFLDKMIALVEGASRQKTPNEIALNTLLVGLTIIFMIVIVALYPFAVYSGVHIPVATLIALMVCLIPTTIGGLLSAIGIAGMDRVTRFNVIAMSGKAVEACGDVDTMILDKTGTITFGNRLAADFYPVKGVTVRELMEYSVLASLEDGTPEGKSIVELARKMGAVTEKNAADKMEFIEFTAQTKMSGVNLENGLMLRKGAGEAIREFVVSKNGKIPADLDGIVENISKLGGTPLTVCADNRIYGVIYLKDTVKPGLAERFARLREIGIKTIMCTGDNPLTAATIAKEAGVDGFIAECKPEDKITISGPYGEFFLPDNLPSTQELIFIGGGAGMAPMRSHLMHLFKTEKTDRPVSFWYGARALKEVPYLDEFHQIEKDFPNFSFNLALDRPDPEADAAGVKYTPGFVHNVLYENYLKNHQAPEDCIYLMCGPPMMIASVVKMLDNLGVPPENILYDNFGS